MTFTQDQHRFMRRALQLAGRGRGYVEPNPMVGCVLVRDGRIVAEGFHERFGQAHAEIMALRNAQANKIDTAGLEVYVTLEPCCHFGKTPPCVEALIQAKVGRVLAAMVDPFPAVAGKGLLQLEAAGIPASAGLCEPQARDLNAAFIKRCRSGLPWVCLKWAQTLDGKIATRTGHSRWVSGSEARRWVHRQRACVDVILTGIGTVLADDPQLTARGVLRRRAARRVVIDPHLKLPLEGRLVRSFRENPQAAPLTVAVNQKILESPVPPEWSAKRDRLQQLGVELVGLPQDSTAAFLEKPPLALRPLLEHLAKAHRASHVWVEGGPTLAGFLLAQGLVDQIEAIVCPKYLGDPRALSAIRGFSIARMDQARGLELKRVRRLGGDLLLTYRTAPADPPLGCHPLAPGAGHHAWGGS